MQFLDGIYNMTLGARHAITLNFPQTFNRTYMSGYFIVVIPALGGITYLASKIYQSCTYHPPKPRLRERDVLPAPKAPYKCHRMMQRRLDEKDFKSESSSSSSSNSGYNRFAAASSGEPSSSDSDSNPKSRPNPKHSNLHFFNESDSSSEFFPKKNKKPFSDSQSKPLPSNVSNQPNLGTAQNDQILNKFLEILTSMNTFIQNADRRADSMHAMKLSSKSLKITLKTLESENKIHLQNQEFQIRNRNLPISFIAAKIAISDYITNNMNSLFYPKDDSPHLIKNACKSKESLEKFINSQIQIWKDLLLLIDKLETASNELIDQPSKQQSIQLQKSLRAFISLQIQKFEDLKKSEPNYDKISRALNLCYNNLLIRFV